MYQDNLFRSNIFVQFGDGFSQTRSTGKETVTEVHVFEFFEEVVEIFTGDFKELFNCHWKHAASSEIYFVFRTVGSRVKPVFKNKFV